ncbi:MAG: non-heme iron oxygenase ferredoxin subunit [Proteobacteria bacterium]|nr:non-heme iron oxygenase ferredoxin subunit [Pseudomonadota bacterium]
MNTPTYLCRTDEVPATGVKRVDFAMRPPLAVFRVEGRFYAVDDTCTHADASLSEGEIEGELVFCPAHSGAFHIPTGRASCFPATVDLRTYPVQIENGALYALLDVT